MIQDFWDEILLFKGLYDRTLDPVAQRCGLTRMELDLLLFLHNNPGHATAAEAVRLRRWTKSHVSVAVHALEERGLLSAVHPPGNRKVLSLTPLPAAENVIREGTAAQDRFMETLNRGVSPEELVLAAQIIQKIARNIRDLEKSEVIP